MWHCLLARFIFFGLVLFMFFNSRKETIRSIRLFSKETQAFVSVEFALLFPVILFSLMMFVELMRITLVIVFVGHTLENIVETLPTDNVFFVLSEEEKKDWLSDEVVKKTYGIASIDNINMTLQTFSISRDFTGLNLDDYHSIPMLNISLLLNEKFITPLPCFFGLGDSFQHEYRQFVGDLINTSVL